MMHGLKADRMIIRGPGTDVLMRRAEQQCSQDLLSSSERRVLRRYRRRGPGAGRISRFGDPAARQPEWCREAVEYLIELDCWAPEIDWMMVLPTRVRFATAADAEWVVRAAHIAGFDARVVSSRAGQFETVIGEVSGLPSPGPVRGPAVSSVAGEP